MMKKNFKEILEKEKEKIRTGQIPEYETKKEESASYDLFYPLKSSEPIRPTVPLGARGGIMIREYYLKHQVRHIEERSPYGELSEENPKVIELAHRQGISPREFIHNVKKQEVKIKRLQEK